MGVFCGLPVFFNIIQWLARYETCGKLLYSPADNGDNWGWVCEASANGVLYTGLEGGLKCSYPQYMNG